MKVPDEFDEFCRWLEFSSEDEKLERYVRGLSDGEKLTLRNFIEELLSDKYSSGELKGILKRSLIDVFPPNAKRARILFEELLRQLDG